MKQRTLSMLVALIGLTATAVAQNYGIEIGGVEVTSSNYTNISASGGFSAVRSGTVTYDPSTRTLTLSNAIIDGSGVTGINFHKDNANDYHLVLAQGTENTVTSDNLAAVITSAPLTISGGGSAMLTSNQDCGIYAHCSSTLDDFTLSIESCEVTASGMWGIAGYSGNYVTVSIANALVKAIGIDGALCDFNTLQLIGVEVASPSGAAWSQTDHAMCNASGSVIKGQTQVVIEPEKNYGIKIGGKLVTPNNYTNISSAGGFTAIQSGTVTYAPETQTLTLSNANISAPSGINGIDFYKDDNTIIADDYKLVLADGTENTVTAGSGAALHTTISLAISGGGSATFQSSTAGGIYAEYQQDHLLSIVNSKVTATGQWGIRGASGSYGTLCIAGSQVRAKGTSGALRDFKTLSLIGVEVALPSGAAWSESAHAICNASGNVVNGQNEVVIIPTETLSKEPYAVVSTDGTTLTFYYDALKEARPGTKYSFETSIYFVPEWATRHKETVTTANFDVSFAEYDGLTWTAIMFYEMENLTTINHLSRLNTTNVTDMHGMFRGCKSLNSIDLSGFITSKVTNMENVFYKCEALTSLDLSSFDTSNVVYTNALFGYCASLTSLDLSNFNTSNVIYMDGMFQGCTSLTSLDLSNFDTSKVTRMDNMFNGCTSLTSLDLSNFDTPKVTMMEGMFQGCTSLTSLDLLTFNMFNVTKVSKMFYADVELKTIYCKEDWSQGKPKESDDMFSGCTSLVGAVGYATGNANDITFANPTTGYFTSTSTLRDVYAVVSTDGKTLTFYWDAKKETRDGTAYSIPWGNSSPGWSNHHSSTITTVDFDVSFANYDGLTSTSHMFYNLQQLTTINNLNRLNTASVTDMSYMFAQCKALTSLDLMLFNTSSATDMSGMFSNADHLTTIHCNDDWSGGNVTSSSNMFSGCSSLMGAVSYSDDNTNDVTCANPTLYFTEAPTVPYGMVSLDGTTLTFYYDNRMLKRDGIEGNTYPTILEISRSSITTVDFDVSFAQCDELTSTQYMFADMKNLKTINNISRLNTANVTNMEGMFYGCESLENLDLSTFNTNQVTNMAGMFYGCLSLKSLGLSGFNTAQVNYMYAMFFDCKSLESLDLSGFNTSNVTNMAGMFDGCLSLKSLDLSGFNTAQVTDMSYMFLYCQSLESLNVTGFNTTNVTDMSYMFYACFELQKLNLMGFNTSNVTDMSDMFAGCTSLTTLDVSRFNTAQVTNMTEMFWYCTGLTTIYCNDNWLKTGLTSDNMFLNCDNLHAVVSYDATKTDANMANPDTGYFTKRLYKMGDANNDDSVTIADVVAVVSHILGHTPAGFNSNAADVSGEGDITIDDAITIVNMILQ